MTTQSKPLPETLDIVLSRKLLMEKGRKPFSIQNKDKDDFLDIYFLSLNFPVSSPK